jgi:hypothetical protein
MRSGIAAKDFTQVVTKKDLKPLEQQLSKLAEKTKDIAHLHSYVQLHENVFEQLQEKLHGRVMFFSIIIIVLMVVIGLSETFYLRRFIYNKKHI